MLFLKEIYREVRHMMGGRLTDPPPYIKKDVTPPCCKSTGIPRKAGDIMWPVMDCRVVASDIDVKTEPKMKASDSKICGHPTGSGSPCRKTQLDKDGRCHFHPKSMNDHLADGLKNVS